MKGTALRSRWEIVSSHIFTYFNFLNLVLAGLILVSGQYKNMLFMGIVITNAVIGIGQELKVKRIIDALSVVTATKARRYENGEICKCDIELLQEGDTVAYLQAASSSFSDNAMMMGGMGGGMPSGGMPSGGGGMGGGMPGGF